MKKIVFLALLIVAIPSARAQRRNINNAFWFRLALTDTINTRLKWEFFLQRRTQNNFSSDPNIFRSPQFKSDWIMVLLSGKQEHQSELHLSIFRPIDLK